MKVTENLKSSTIVLDSDTDFTKDKFKEVFQKIKEYKKLPFHDVFLSMPSKYFVKFWELKGKKEDDGWKNMGIKHDNFTIEY
jgi:hypothetical protein